MDVLNHSAKFVSEAKKNIAERDMTFEDAVVKAAETVFPGFALSVAGSVMGTPTKGKSVEDKTVGWRSKRD